MKHYIDVSGCDDGTSVVLELTDEQAATVAQVADAICEASTYDCMPTMSIRPASPREIEESE